MLFRPILISATFLAFHFFEFSSKIDFKQLDHIDLRQSITVYDSENNLLTHSGDLQLKVKFEEIPKPIINALLATEDMHFWSHFGLNIPAMLMAVGENLTKKQIVRGGSTITQQLAKNLLFTEDKSLIKKKTERKLTEILVAIRLERTLTKEKILEYYMNRVYFGRGAYGVKAAAKIYFNKTINGLSIEEIAFLTGLVRAPSLYSGNYEKALDRATHVLNRMLKVGFITKKYTKNELRSSIKLVSHTPQFHLSYFINWVVSTIPKEILDSQQPIMLYTTVNTGLQKQIAELIPKIKAKSRFDFSEIAFIACGLDGSVSAMIGGFSAGNNYGFNRATQAFRQAGSIFKIYTYLCAFLQGMRYTDTIEDTPPTIGGWTPSNYMHNEVGFVTLERAFAESINGATVRLAMDCGLNNIINLARVFGLTGTLPNDCSLILGSACITLYQLAQTMLIICNKGYHKMPYGIREIRNHQNEVIWSQVEEISSTAIIADKEAISQMLHVMYSVVDSGTGRYAKSNKYQVGGKTGTSQDYRDVWFGAISPFLITCAWCGHDNNAPMDRSKQPKLVNPAVALCKEVIQIESKDYEEVSEAAEVLKMA